MGLFEKISNWANEPIFDEVQDETTVEGIPDTGSTWGDYGSNAGTLWQYNYAIEVVANLLSYVLINVSWKTYKSKGETITGDEWYRLNVSMNNKETAAEFFGKLATKLIKDKRALIIEDSKKQFFIADSFDFLSPNELVMKENTFTNVTVGDTTLHRTFKENQNCMYIKAPQRKGLNLELDSMANDYKFLKELVNKGACKALGSKYNLSLPGTAKNKYDAKYVKDMQKVYVPLMEKDDAVFITYQGEKLSDLTEKQRGSEVQQVLNAVKNSSDINQEILTSVGKAYGIPVKFMLGDYSEDNEDVYAMFITMFAKPFLVTLEQKFTMYLLEKEDIINGAKIEANIGTIKFNEMLKSANAIDKLIGSGAYTINEIREKIGDDPVAEEEGDTRFITKNYAVLKEYVKGNGE